VEEALLVGTREEPLGEVFRFRGIRMPVPAQVLVHGPPIPLGQGAEGLAARLDIRRPRGADEAGASPRERAGRRRGDVGHGAAGELYTSVGALASGETFWMPFARHDRSPKKGEPCTLLPGS